VDALEHTDPNKLRELLDAVLLIGSDLSLTTLLGKVLESAKSLTGARYAALGVLDRTQHHLEQFMTTGLDPETKGAIGELPTGQGVLGLLITDQRPIRLSDISAHPLSAGFPENHPPMKSFIGVPVLCNKKAFGNIYLTDKEDGSDFNDQDEAIVLAVAKAAGIAIENSLLLTEANEYSLTKERERIARDLHDEVIQRLFAVGLSMQGIIKLVDDERVRSRLYDLVDQLDSTIKQIRTTIFALDNEAPATSKTGVRHRLLSLVNEYQGNTDCEVSLSLSGAIDTVVNERHAEEALAFLREALSNAVRHSKCNHIDVEVTIKDNHVLTLSVTDDGTGLVNSHSTGKGISNMQRRAREIGGTLTFEHPRDKGLRVRLEIPIKL